MWYISAEYPSVYAEEERPACDWCGEQAEHDALTAEDDAQAEREFQTGMQGFHICRRCAEYWDYRRPAADFGGGTGWIGGE